MTDLYSQIKSGNIEVPLRAPAEHRFWIKVDKNGPIHPIHGKCWKWLGTPHPDGYCGFSIKNRGVKAHRYSYELLIGPIPEGMMVLHKCDNRQCVNPAHLFIGNALVNQQDAIAKKRNSFGERNGRAKLTEADVLRIRERREEGLSQQLLADEFGVSKPMIRYILQGKNWRHV